MARANRADAFGRGLWAHFQLVYTSLSFDLQNLPPQEAKSEQAFFGKHQEVFAVEAGRGGNHQIASFTHLTGYSSAYYTYLWDKMVAGK